MKFGSLFAGIGGFDLGFERAGLSCAWQVEIDPYAQRVLAKHWPEVRRWDDVRTFPPEPTAEWSGIDLICGGFPCQDISNAGKRAGLDGERSGLWSEFARIVRVLRPKYVVVENVAAILVRGIDRVLGDLAEIGLDAEWQVLPATAFGKYHDRARLFIVAHDPSQCRHSRDLLEASPERRALLESRRLRSLAVATRGAAENIRLESEPELVRLVGRVPNRTQRLECLGNCVVPDIAEFIGRQIIEAAA